MRRSVDGSLEDKVASNEEGSSRSLDLVVVNIVLPMFRVTTSSCFAMKSLIFRDSILVGMYGVEDGRFGTAYTCSRSGSITPYV